MRLKDKVHEPPGTQLQIGNVLQKNDSRVFFYCHVNRVEDCGEVVALSFNLISQYISHMLL